MDEHQMKDAALRLALEALEYPGPSWLEARQPAITAIKQALEQPESEPVCYLWVDPKTQNYIVDRCDHPLNELIPVYTSPPKREPLTDEEIENLWQNTSPYYDHQDFARSIEAAHGIFANAQNKGEA